jgi:hypothetical protein
MRKLVLFLCCTLSTALAAESADLQITTLNTSKTTVTTGERFSVVLRWRNLGPDTAHDVVATLGANSGAFITTGAGTENWPCEPAFGGDAFTCKGFLLPGAEAEMIVTMLSPSEVPAAPFAARAEVTSSTPDPQPANNSLARPMTLIAGPDEADLTISPESQEQHVAAGAPFTIPLVVRNGGPEAASDVMISLSFTPGTRIPVSAASDGWTCENPTHSPWLIICRRPFLDAGVTSPVSVSVTAPQTAGDYGFYARVAAAGAHDPAVSNLALANVHVGTEATEVRTRMLIPFPYVDVPGIDGAHWTSNTVLFVRSRIDLAPDLCQGLFAGPHCAAPFGEPISFDNLTRWEKVDGGLLLSVRKIDEDQVDITSRIWDRSRETQTAGTGVPTVREHDFTFGTLQLLGIPLSAHDRYTLRVYDLEGRDGARVAIRLYADAETTPRATVERTLTTPKPLSFYPAYLQLDPASLATLAGAGTMRIEVQPLDEGVRIWAFVTVTNNDTHHVTTFSAR